MSTAQETLLNEDFSWYLHFYNACLAVLGTISLVLLVYRYRKSVPVSTSTSGNGSSSGGGVSAQQVVDFAQFQRQYLSVFLLCAFSDWLKGPYVYALYEEYGFTTLQIAWLFAGGFLSSLVFGTIAGALSDLWGRKFMGIIFCAVYAMSALTKVVNSFWVLMLGRVLSGIATSLLFTTFEAWMVAEHRARGFPEQLLTNTFSKVTLGNGVVAVLAGVAAQAAAMCCGYAAPFLLAIPCLAIASVLMVSWRENYGNSQIQPLTTLSLGVKAILADSKLQYLGVCQAIFEATMYLWVFYWTPSVAPPSARQLVPYGVLFAVYMAALMIGGTLPEAAGGLKSIFTVACALHAVCACTLAVAAAFFENKVLVFLAFTVFEGCVGVYFPTHGTLRSQHIPEDTRAAVMSLYRLPMNMLVVGMLQLHLKERTVMAVLTMGQLIALLALRRFRALTLVEQQVVSSN